MSLATETPRTVTLLLREGLHPGLAEAPLRRLLRLHGPGAIRWSWSLTPRRRGEHRAGPLTARVLGPWKLAWAQRELLPGEPVRVYPQVRWEGRVGQLLVLAQREIGATAGRRVSQKP